MTRPDLDALAALLDKATPFAATSLERDLVNALPELIAYVRELEQQVQACGIRPRGKSVAPEAIAAALAMRERCADICSAMARERTKDPAAWATAAAYAAAYDAERRAQCAIIRDEIPLSVVRAALNRRMKRA